MFLLLSSLFFVVDVVGCPLHLDLKAVWVCKACWVEWLQHNWHGWRDVATTGLLTIPASVTACRIFSFRLFLFFYGFSCTLSITNITSSMIMMSGHFWFMVVFMTGWAVSGHSVIFPQKKKLCLLVSGYWGYCMCMYVYMDRSQGQMSSWEIFTLLVAVTWVPLSGWQLFFYVFIVLQEIDAWWGHFQGPVLGMKLPLEVWCHFWCFKKLTTIFFRHARWIV